MAEGAHGPTTNTPTLVVSQFTNALLMLEMPLPLVQLRSGTGWVFLAFGLAPFAGLHISAQQVVFVVKWLPQPGVRGTAWLGRRRCRRW